MPGAAFQWLTHCLSLTTHRLPSTYRRRPSPDQLTDCGSRFDRTAEVFGGKLPIHLACEHGAPAALLAKLIAGSRETRVPAPAVCRAYSRSAARSTRVLWLLQVLCPALAAVGVCAVPPPADVSPVGPAAGLPFHSTLQSVPGDFVEVNATRAFSRLRTLSMPDQRDDM